MTAASLIRFLEDFDRPAGANAVPVAALPEFEPVFGPGQGESPQELGGNSSVEELLARAREEGAAMARDELAKRHRDEMHKMRSELEMTSRQAREAELSALAGAVQSLFAQYDSWLDRLFEFSLRPLLAAIARNSAMEEFKSRLLEAAGREGVPVSLAGPEVLVGTMAEMLRSHGLNVETQADEGKELCASFDSQSLQTRFSRIDELLSSRLKGPREARDD